MENKEVINSDKEFLNWIYERMICIHGEKDLHDYMINFKAIIDRSGSVATPKEERIFSGTAEEILDSLESTNDAYYHHSQIEPVIASLRQQLKEREEALKELLPIAENELHQSTCIGYSYTKLKAIIERARKLISK